MTDIDENKDRGVEEFITLMETSSQKKRRCIALSILSVFEGDMGYENVCVKDKFRNMETRGVIIEALKEMTDPERASIIRKCREYAGYCIEKDVVIDQLTATAWKKLCERYLRKIPETIHMKFNDELRILNEGEGFLSELVMLHYTLSREAMKRGIGIELINSTPQFQLLMSLLGSVGQNSDDSIDVESGDHFRIQYDIPTEFRDEVEAVIKNLFPSVTLIRRGKPDDQLEALGNEGDYIDAGYYIVFGSIDPEKYRNSTCKFHDGRTGWKNCPRKFRGETLEVIINYSGGYEERNTDQKFKMPLRWDNSDIELRDKCYEKAVKLYGDPLPATVSERLNREIDGICRNGYETLFLTVSSLIKESGLRHSEYRIMGCIGNSLVAFLLGITGEVNPLKPHYYCENGDHSEFSKTHAQYGYELPDKNCPVCGRKLKKDGFSLSEYFFMGSEYEKSPDFWLNVLSRRKEEILYLLGVMKGVGQIVGCAGQEGTLYHPGGVMLIPDYAGDARKYTDVICGKNGEMVSTQQYCDGLSKIFTRVDIHNSERTDHLARVEDLTGIPVESIAIDDKSVIEAFQPANTGFMKGISGIGTLMGQHPMEILTLYPVKDFDDLARVYGLIHGIGVWEDNAKNILIQGIYDREEIITSSEDIFDYLVAREIDEKAAYLCSNEIIIGPDASDKQDIFSDLDIPKWYIKSCEKILYLYPRAHNIAAAMEIWRLAWYKVHYPKEFFRACLETAYINDTIKEVILAGDESVVHEIEEMCLIVEKQGYDAWDQNARDALMVAHEMYQKGYDMPGLWETDPHYEEYLHS